MIDNPFIVKLKKMILKIRQNKSFRKFVWTSLVAVLAIALQHLAEFPVEGVYITIGTLLLEQAIKYINVTMLGDIGVEQGK